jgi:protein-tyrosine phosphatase
LADLAAPAPLVPSVDGPRSWPRATAWLVVLGTFFYASYGFANWLASQRSDVPVIVFSWERAIPFLAWTIVPYWSTNVFFALSLYLCRNRVELDSHAKRLLTAQVIAVACFIAFPLRASFAKPQISGVFGFFFDALGAFDMPFNQAPSLHIALTTILFDLYIRILPRRIVPVFMLWSLLVVASVMTTYQHHFIDVPTGFLLGLVCIWMWPLAGGNRLALWRTTADAQRRALALRYAIAAGALALLAIVLNGAVLWLLWPAVALAVVSAAYLGFGTGLFAKGADGRIDWATRLILLPYLLGAWLNARLWTRNEPRCVEIADGVWLGRFPSAADCRDMHSIVDMTCEFSRPGSTGIWAAIPMLDLVAPEVASLAAAAEKIEKLRPQGPVLVCCALGYGRSAAVLAVWLVRTQRATDLQAALRQLKEKRPRLALNARQLRAVTGAADAA